MSSVAVIGNCYFDEIYTIDTFPKPDEKILASNLELMLGGSATNTGVGIATLGLDTYLFTVMGSDEDAYRLFKEVRNKGIKSQYINHINGKSGRTIILLDKNKSSTKIGYQGVCSDLSKNVLFSGLSDSSFDHVHLSSVNIDTLRIALSMKTTQRFSLDFGAKTLQSSRAELLDIMQYLDVVTVNQGTFKHLFKCSINQLETLNLPYDLIVTAGRDGIYAIINDNYYHQEIIPTVVVDTTGAGDAACAAIIFGYVNKFSPEKILQLGVTAASIKIRSFGGSNGHATLSDLSHLIS